MKFNLNWNITTYEATAMGAHQVKKKLNFMRGAESSKQFMS